MDKTMKTISVDMRKMRAAKHTAELLTILSPFLADNEGARAALFEAFYEADATIDTDLDRKLRQTA